MSISKSRVMPHGVKAIGCTWVFKTKKDSQGNIKRHKKRLVARGFTQREGIDYIETSSSLLLFSEKGLRDRGSLVVGDS